MMFSSRDKNKAAQREVTYRQWVYSRKVAEGSMKEATAEKQIAIMQEIADEYGALADEEDRKGRLL